MKFQLANSDVIAKLPTNFEKANVFYFICIYFVTHLG